MPPSEHAAFAGDLTRRIEQLEKFVAQQGTSISEVVKQQVTADTRIERLEALAQARAITEAREDERDKALYDRLDRMEDQIEESKSSLQEQIKTTREEVKAIRGVGAKALWVFISAILVAAAGFVIKGGLA